MDTDFLCVCAQYKQINTKKYKQNQCLPLTQRFSSAYLRGVFDRKYHQSHFTDQEAEALERQDI